MRDMVRLIRYRRLPRKWQPGFTLLELVVALMVSAILIVGTVAMFRVLVVNSVATTNQAVANLQVHYADYWISHDVVQAGNITLAGNSTTGNFPLIITIPGDITIPGNPGNSTVIYNVENMEDKLGNDLWRLYRTKIEADGTIGNSTIAEYLINPWTVIPPEKEALGNQNTICTIPPSNETPPDVVILQVGALVDNKVALARYEIHPRVTGVPTPTPTPTLSPTPEPTTPP
jgi:prepilin-type N-terminal cleavage/methylation domain-containing protein